MGRNLFYYYCAIRYQRSGNGFSKTIAWDKKNEESVCTVDRRTEPMNIQGKYGTMYNFPIFALRLFTQANHAKTFRQRKNDFAL